MLPSFAEEMNPSQPPDSVSPNSERTEPRGHNPYEAIALAANDAATTFKVKDALRREEISDVRVVTTAGVVELKGIVASSAIAIQAEQIAGSTPGVRRVENDLEVSPIATN